MINIPRLYDREKEGMSNALASVDKLNQCSVSLASHVVIPCQLSACPGKMGPFMQASDKLKNETSVKAIETAELLAKVHT